MFRLSYFLIFLTGVLNEKRVDATEFRIGIMNGVESLAWHNARHAVDEWNNVNGVVSGISLTLVAPSDGFGSGDDRMCDIIQRKLAAVIVSGESDAVDDILLAYSMCDRFSIPCITMSHIQPAANSNFVTSILPDPNIFGKAAAELIQNLGWNSFLFVYQDAQCLPDVADLLSVWHNQRGTRTLLKVLQLPADQNHYEVFLKHVRERLKQTNLVVHTKDVGTIHTLLSAASFLNMTENRYSFLFTNPDLVLLDDFLESLQRIYKCNITGFQLIQHDPAMKVSLGLTVDAVSVIGAALSSLTRRGNPPVPEPLLCESDDSWVDGQLLNEAIREVSTENSLTGKMIFSNDGKRLNTTFTGITRANGRFQKLGEFDASTNHWHFESDYSMQWRFQLNGTDLAGQKLKVVVYLEEPFVIKVEDGIGYDGFCVDLLIEMSKLLNFTFEIVEVEDGAYGVQEESGQWNGIIGVLQRHEADLSVSAVTITYSRVKVVDFTLPFMHLGIAILIGTNIEDSVTKSSSSSLFTFMEPLSPTVWIALAFSYFAVGVAMCILARFSPYEWFDIEQIDKRDRSMDNHKNQFDLLNSLWFATGSLMHQGSDVIPRAAATRTVAIIWWLFTLIIFSSYTAQLAAFLTAERMSSPLESAADLVNQQKIKFGTLKNGSTMAFFRDSQIPIYERMWSIMESQSPTVFVNSSKEGIARVKAGNFAYLMESSMLEYYMKQDCSLQTIGGGLLDSKGYGIALPKGSPLRHIFSKTVLQLQERTILEALKNKWWKGNRETMTCPQSSDPHKVLDRVLGIFYVMLTGLIVAFFMSIGEYCIESKQQSVRLDLTWMGKLINWFHQRKTKKEEKMLPRRPQLAATRLDQLATLTRPKPTPQSTKDSGEHYLFDEHSDSLQISSPGSITDIQRRRSQNKDEFRKITRLIPPGDEALISRRISTISR